MQEAMPAPDFEEGKKNQDIGSDEKTLRKINELEDEWKKLRNKIDNTHNEEEKQILKFEKEDLEKIIRQQYKYYDKVRNDKELNDLGKKAGKKKLAEVIDFQEEKRRIEKRKEIDAETKKSVGGNFLASYENFRKKRNI